MSSTESTEAVSSPTPQIIVHAFQDELVDLPLNFQVIFLKDRFVLLVVFDNEWIDRRCARTETN